MRERYVKRLCALIVVILWAWSVVAQTPAEEGSLTNFNEISFYPNPAKYFVTISEPAHVVIVDIVGKTVIDKVTTRTKEKIDISNLPEAVYFIKIDSGILEKFIISRS